MIYFCQPVEGGPVKIGYSANVATRLKQLETHYGVPLALLATMEGGPSEETEIHTRFAHLRIAGTGRRGRFPEQFRPASELMEFIGKPLFVNQPEVEAMQSVGVTVAIIHLKGTLAYAAWLDGVNVKSHIPKAALFRLAMAEWAARNGYPVPPEM